MRECTLVQFRARRRAATLAVMLTMLLLGGGCVAHERARDARHANASGEIRVVLGPLRQALATAFTLPEHKLRVTDLTLSADGRYAVVNARNVTTEGRPGSLHRFAIVALDPPTVLYSPAAFNDPDQLGYASHAARFSITCDYCAILVGYRERVARLIALPNGALLAERAIAADADESAVLTELLETHDVSGP